MNSQSIFDDTSLKRASFATGFNRFRVPILNCILYTQTRNWSEKFSRENDSRKRRKVFFA